MRLTYLTAGSAYEEPVVQCPECQCPAHADWVDIGFGPYTQQAGPFHCYACGWTEKGCMQPVCLEDRCSSWLNCRGDAITAELPAERDILVTDTLEASPW